MTKKHTTIKRRLKGTVVSDKMSKTVVVEIIRFKMHPKYQRQFRLTKRFKAHDKNNEYKTGDKVIVEEVRPLSREKRWVVVSKI